VVAVGEEGIVLDRRPSNYWSVRFSRGAYLIDTQYLDGVNPSEA
jgi:Protein of unknown function (DUF3148)